MGWESDQWQYWNWGDAKLVIRGIILGALLKIGKIKRKVKKNENEEIRA